jgi:SAM-dependent methyltransferase
LSEYPLLYNRKSLGKFHRVLVPMNLLSALADDDVFSPAASHDRATVVKLCDGTEVDLATLDLRRLRELHWEQERAFARRVLQSPKGSRERAAAFSQGYDTVLSILRRIVDPSGGLLVMGLDPRYKQMVLDLLVRRGKLVGRPPRLFEIGYASGMLLVAAHANGVDVAGIEVSDCMRRDACRQLPIETHPRLYLGDFLTHDLDGPDGRYDLIYWNDVIEHIPPDEIADFLAKIHRMLAPGGTLVTITPNWHMRPSDVTAEFLPPRTEAEGFHLKEYTLRETTALLRAAGFSRVATPLLVTRGRIVMCGAGLANLKRLCEPLLEIFPFRLVQMCCIGFALGCTIATKAE